MSQPARVLTAPGTPVAIRMDPSERHMLIGHTGEGKTHLARFLLRPVVEKGWRVVIVDPKLIWMGKRPDWARSGPGTLERPYRVDRFDDHHLVQLYQPSVSPAWKDPGLERLCLDILGWAAKKEGNSCWFLVDESVLVADHQHQNPGLLGIWQMGRALEVGGMVIAQMPTRVPEAFKSQAEHWEVMHLPKKEHRQEVADYTHSPQIVTHELRKWEWWHAYVPDRAPATLMAPVDGAHPVPGPRKLFGSAGGSASHAR